MGAGFHNALFAQHQDAVVILDGGQAVGNGQGGAAVGQFFQALAHQDLALVVQCTGGLVQNQDGRVLQEHTGNGDALLLAAGQLDAALSDVGVKAVLQGQNEPLGTGQTGRLHDLLAGGTGLAVGNVLGHRAAEQVHVLLHDADVLPQALQGDMADILPVDEDAAVRHLVKAGDQVAQGGLAAAGSAHQRQPLPGVDVQTDIVQHLVVVIRVLKADVLEPDRAGAGLQGHGVRGVLNGHRGVHDLGKALDAGHTALELLGKFHDAPDGGNEGGDVQHVGHQVTGGDPAVHQRQAACQNDHQIHQAVEQAGGGVEGTHGVVTKGLDLLKILVALGKFFPLFVLGGKRLDHTLPQQAVLDGGVQFTDLHPLLAEPCPQPAVQVHRHHTHQGHAGEHRQRQRDAGLTQDDKGHHDLDGRDEKFLRAVVGELGHIEQVVGDAAHDGAHLGVVVVGVVQTQQVVKGVAAHIRLDVHAHDVADAGHIVAGRAVDDAQHEVHRRQPQHDARRQGDAHPHGGVGDGAHDLGQHDVAQSRQCGTEQVQEQGLFVLDQIGQEAPDQRAAAGVMCPGVIDLLFWHDTSHNRLP